MSGERVLLLLLLFVVVVVVVVVVVLVVVVVVMAETVQHLTAAGGHARETPGRQDDQ